MKPEHSAPIAVPLHMSHLSRRALFTSASVAAASAVVASIAKGEEIAKDVAPASKDAEDRASAIKITALFATRAGGKAYIRIDTSHKISGWGEVTGLEPDIACALARSFFELLDGENPTRIEHLWQKIFRAHRDMRGGSIETGVLAAIDMALWDIAGKLHGVPVYRLLGGPCRDKIRLYPSTTAFKIGPGGPKEWAATPKAIEGFIKEIERQRTKLGPDGAVMFDAHSSLPPAFVIQLANAIKSYDVMFIEEPAVPGNIEVFKRIKAAVTVPLATGERDRTIWGVIPYLHERCIDILQPDCGQTGGISQVKKIATLAEAYTTPIAPHCTMSELGLTASMHAAASIPNFMIHEAYLDGHIMPPGVARKNWDVDKNGNASLPQGPGLGVEIDLAEVEKVNQDPKKKFRWPTSKGADGSVRDY